MFGWFSRKKEEPEKAENEPPRKEVHKKKEIQAKVRSLQNIDYRSRKGSFKLPSDRLPYRRNMPARVGSLTNLSYKPKGGQIKIFSEKVDFRTRAQSKVAENFRSSRPSTPDVDKRNSIVEMLIESIKSTVNIQSSRSGTKVKQTESSKTEPSKTADTKKCNTVDLGRVDDQKSDGETWSVDRVEQLITPENDENENEDKTTPSIRNTSIDSGEGEEYHNEEVKTFQIQKSEDGTKGRWRF